MDIEEACVGMKFDNEENVYTFYKSYAHKLGFSVRKQYVHRVDGQVRRRTFCCSRQGQKGVDKRSEQVKFEHPISRVNCLAQMTCQLKPNGMFEVISFNAEHSHELTPTPMKHMLRSQRQITLAHKAVADDAAKAGLSTKSTIDLLTSQSGGREFNGFLDSDFRNYISAKRRTEMIKGDGHAIMDYFHKMQLQDPSYFYLVQLDDNDNSILNVFWADGRSIIDYQHFGDVVCFDTTYRTNEYGRPFAPFIGVNQHKKSIIFGAALLYDETISSFKWLFETFLSAMSGKHPRTILTDQCPAMANAIEEVFSETHHRLCVWHIYQNAAKNLSHVFHSSKQFAYDFSSCVYGYEEEDKWLQAWDDMLDKYMLTDNKWCNGIFEVRKKWAMVYGRHMFTADMMSTQRSESMNNVLKKYLDAKNNFMHFFDNYNRLLSNKRYEELLIEFKMRERVPILQADVEMLRHASKIYTPTVFKMFQDEYMKILDCIMYKVDKSEHITSYKVQCGRKDQEHLVTLEASTQSVKCSCMKFIFVGILCAHTLKILDKKNIKQIPPQYIWKRWTRDAKIGMIEDNCNIAVGSSPQESIGKRYSSLSHNFREILTLASESEDMYEHACEDFKKLLKDLQVMKVSNDPSNLSNSKDNKTFSPIISEVKKKATVGRPSNRIKGALERKKKIKRQSKSQDGGMDSTNKSKEKKKDVKNIDVRRRMHQLLSRRSERRITSIGKYYSVLFWASKSKLKTRQANWALKPTTDEIGNFLKGLQGEIDVRVALGIVENYRGDDNRVVTDKEGKELGGLHKFLFGSYSYGSLVVLDVHVGSVSCLTWSGEFILSTS
ncbi:protein FAR1-RELATED SEQUENCE 5-like [Mercurialis annua]|uniref:protein FAR1-RELATED SEQUENCE 5-like n=1 Tax=Mercurialis annua TaxID=3986 RepID=UPI00215FCC11|nr:protein FAR1-RELATED SEQUENCE 5-like [Mercurialis annua]